MAVTISGVQENTPASKAGIQPGDTLVSISGNVIMDVLDYRFYQNERKLRLEILTKDGKHRLCSIKKGEYEELGLIFDTYLMDEQHSCKNKCVFCFIDQLPSGLRDTLYFKDDDSRLSFLFGNYITLTNITEHEIARIIKMHISPINISVHTTNPELRVRMMKNKRAGDAFAIMRRFSDAGLTMNCQLVLCPGFNDGQELIRSLADLSALPSVQCVAVVPVGLTKFREGLTPLTMFDRASARAVLETVERFSSAAFAKTGVRRIYAADEFYLLAGEPIPEAPFYGDFPQLENGVGLWALLKSEAEEALQSQEPPAAFRRISSVTGTSAYPLISNLVDMAAGKWHNLKCTVYPIKNDFFGHTINVTGLVTGGDIINQLNGRDLGEELLVPQVMLRREGDLFLDDVSLEQLSEALGVKIRTVPNDGYEFMAALAGK